MNLFSIEIIEAFQIGNVKFRIRVSKCQFSFSIYSFNFNVNSKILFVSSVTNFVTGKNVSKNFDPNKEFCPFLFLYFDVKFVLRITLIF